MSQDQDPAMVAADLENLKARADLLKVPYHPSIGAEKLREKIAAALAEVEAVVVTSVVADVVVVAPVVAPVQETRKPQTAVELLNIENKRLRNEANALVRIRLTCMNPAKKDWNGEIITVGNSVVGTLKKYIPFQAEDGWHVPQMMLNVLQDRQCQVFTTIKAKNGVQVRKGKLIKEFAIEVLPQLTKDELHDLAQRQAMAKAID